ncbi:CBF/Mak21 family-domain-containing protein [Stachybotrys elegans]|uniref:CBF/Mak21 family-domain-containing protein n=1 Tax=Stachybotrys elegans TaxID=80388 RepID=A0A8K0T6A0_9HYPO|nr:CBF/Mak21 family-domain-containing protein [Stachybotrys elegans]
MPTAVSKDKRRKRASEGDGDAPRKARRSSSSSQDSDAEDPSAKILLMEQGILESRKNYNDIALLLKTMKQTDGNPESMLAAVALCRIFVRLLAQGALIPKKTLSEKETVVVSWLKDQLAQYRTGLLQLLQDEELAETVLTLCMRLLKAQGEHLYDRDEYNFPTVFLQEIVAAIITSDNEDVRQAYIQGYAEQYDDIRFYTFKSVKAVAELDSTGLSQEDLFDRAFALISPLDGVPSSPDELEDFYVPKPKKKSHQLRSVHHQKQQGETAWLALMKLVTTEGQRKRILDVISTAIAPWFVKPELLADFLTDSYNAGGSMSLLALSGVFYLIQERNLDYPSFYPKLYSLLDRDILQSQHRSPFFRLLDTFLGSTHLPAALVASFIKRLARLSLNASPSAIAAVVPFIYNLFRRHPTCTFMLHRVPRTPEEKASLQENGLEDPFLPEETDPMETQAIDSCLWEVVQLQSHYHPNIATISKILSEQFTKQSYNMEDFLDHSYSSLLEAELSKDIRKPPVVEFHIPKRVFLPEDPSSGAAGSLVGRLWDFGGSAEGTSVVGESA